MNTRLLPKRKGAPVEIVAFGCDSAVKAMLTAEAARLGIAPNRLYRSLAYELALAVQHNHPQLPQLPDVFPAEPKAE